MRRWALLLALGLPLAATMDAGAQPRQGNTAAQPRAAEQPAQPRPADQAAQPRPADQAAQPRPADAVPQPRQGPPHEWAFGVWTGGIFPPGDTDTPACFGTPIVIFTRDLVMRVSSLETAYRQRTIETVAQQPDGLEFRFTPVAPQVGPLGPRMPPDVGFGCAGNPNTLRVERKGPDEIAFPGCNEFPANLKRCTTPR